MTGTSREPMAVLFVDPDGRLEPVSEALRREDGTISTRTVATPADVPAELDGVDALVVLDAPETETHQEVDGIEQLNRANDVAEDVPVVLFSIDNDADLVWRALGAGAADVICVDAERSVLLTRRIRHAAGKGESFQTDSELLDSLLDHLPHQIFIKDDEGRIADASAVTAAEYGFTREQLVGLTDYELLEPDLADMLYEEEDRIMRTGEPIVNKTEHWTDDEGRDHWVSSTKAARYDDENNVVGIIGTTRDVTEEKRQEKMMNALHEASRDLVAAETKAEISAVTVDIARDIPDLPAVEIALYDDRTGRLTPAPGNDSDVSVFDPFESEFAMAYETGDARYVYEKPDGWAKERPERTRKEQAARSQEATVDGIQVDTASLTAEAARTAANQHREHPSDSDESPVAVLLPLGDHGVLGVVDPSARFTEFTLDLARTLASHVEASLTRADREEQLRRREHELQRQNERLEEFASIISHDLRNPLSVAKGYLEMIQETGDTSYADEVASSLDRMDSLTGELLTLARKGQVVGDTERVSIATVAETAWATVDTNEASLELAVGAEGHVDADPDRLAELFENLFRNAVEHGGPGVVVRVGTTEHGFYVEDTGPGIDADDREDVLEMGYTTSDDGTGFGLYIVTTIAQAHGWTVDIGESPEGGARIVVEDVTSS